MCCGDVDRCGARERTVSAQALIGDDAKRIDIGLRRGMLALRRSGEMYCAVPTTMPSCVICS